jgi:hypothetical protein
MAAEKGKETKIILVAIDQDGNVPVKQYERTIAKATTDDWLPACGTL